jgi:nucleotide-binding universal stress UspA family protein
MNPRTFASGGFAVAASNEVAIPIDSIFHPTDLSEASFVAFVHALKIALLARSELTILHATDTGGDTVSWKDFPGVRQTLERWGELPKGSSKRAIAELGMTVEKVTGHGPSPIKTVTSYLQENPAQLVVLSSEGREGIPRFLKPSFAEPIARKTRAMTLFVPNHTRGFVDPDTGRVTLDRILIPIDHNPRPRPAIDLASAFVRALDDNGGVFDLLHVGERGKAPAVELPDETGWSCEKHYENGDVVDAILRIAENHHAELIVMTTAGSHGILDSLRGTTTEKVVRAANCPVLAIPEG